MSNGLFGPLPHLLQREALGTFLHDDSGGDLFGGVRDGHTDDGDIRDAR